MDLEERGQQPVLLCGRIPHRAPSDQELIVVATRDLARALASEFGDQVLNPPSTPMLLIGSDGRVTLTDYGSKSPERIVELAPCR